MDMIYINFTLFENKILKLEIENDLLIGCVTPISS
jgi:hypothetical protein